MHPDYEHYREKYKKDSKASVTSFRLPGPLKEALDLIASMEGDVVSRLILEGLVRVVESRLEEPSIEGLKRLVEERRRQEDRMLVSFIALRKRVFWS